MTGWPGQKVGTAPAAQPAPQPAPQQGGPALRPVLSLPDTRADREEARDETRTDLAVQGDARAQSKDRFDRITTYRKEFNSEPLVRDFRTVQAATKQIIDLATRESDKPGPGDISLIFSFMKTLDPTSVVREGEFATAQNAGGVPETVLNAYNRLLEGGRLSPELKREFASTAASIYNSRLQSYNTFAQDYRGLIQSEGEDPDKQGVRLAEPLDFGGTVATRGAGLGATPDLRAAADGEQALSERDMELQAKLSEAWAAGATLEQLQAIAAPYGHTIPLSSQEELDAARAAGRGISVSPSQASVEDPRVKQLADEFEARFGEGGYDVLAMQGTSGALADESGAVGSTIAQALEGDFNIADNYDLNVAVERELVRRARERTGGLGTAVELLGGGSSVRGLGNAAMNAGRALAARGENVSRSAILSQMGRQAGVDGAKVGAVFGFGSGEGAADSALGAVGGAGAGYVLGRGIQTLLNRRAGPGAAGGNSGGSGGGGGPVNPTPGQQVVQAADSFNAATGANVRPIPADVGGSVTRRASGATVQSVLGGKPIIEAAQAVNTEAQAGVRALASRQGAVPGSRQAGGEVAIKGAEKTMARAKLKVDALYAKARKEAGGAEVELPMARTVLQGHIDELSRVPGGAEGLSTLRALADDIGSKRFPVDAVKSMRSTLRDKFVKDGLRGSDIERRVNEVVDAADLDIEDGLIALGKQGAARAYAEASKAASERFALIDEVLSPILGAKGEKSGEAAFAAIQQLSKGDAVTLGKFMRALPEDEAGSVRGLLIDRLGRATPGQQDAGGEAFSLARFLTQWNDEGLSREAKNVLFNGETIAALDDLARVAQGTKEGQKFANFSNTAGSIMFNNLLNGAPLGMALYSPGAAVATGVASTAAQVGMGRLLASPSFARWLAKMPRQATDAAVAKHAQGLSKIAAADGAIASDALGLQQMILGRVGSGQVPVAAEGQDIRSAPRAPTNRPQQ